MAVKARERPDEVESQAALAALEILDTEPDQAFDSLVRAAALVCGTPISLITLIDRDRQWFKANHGMVGLSETPRDLSFCAHAVLGDELFEIADTTKDERFSTNPYVATDGGVRFYAGMPIRLTSGEHLGTLCVVDHQPRVLTAEQREILRCLGNAATQALEGRAARRELERERERLRNSEDHLARTNSLAGVGGWHMDLVTNQISWSTETRRIHGLPEDYVPALDTAIELYEPSSRAPIRAAVEHAIATGEGWDLELQLVRADGELIWVRTVGTAELVDGTPVRLVGAFQDVSARVRETQALQDANARTALATEVAGVGIWDFDLVTRETHWDARMHRLYGLDSRVGKVSYEVWQQRLPPESLAAIRAEVAAAIDGRRSFELEFEVIWPDGSTHVLRSLAHVSRDSNGSALRLVGANWDVTEPRALGDQLALQASIAIEANRAGSLADAVRSVIEQLRAHAGCALAHVYLQSPDDRTRLVPTGLWSAPVTAPFLAFMDETATTILDSQAPTGVLDLESEAFTRGRAAWSSGLRAGVAAPVLVGDEVVALIELYATDASAFDPRSTELVRYAGIQLGRVMDRERSEQLQATALAEKTAMLQEIHHRVKNNLQMISSLLNIQARKIADPTTKSSFMEAQARVHSIALLHEVLYQSGDLGRVDMRAYVEKLVHVLRRAHGDSASRARIDAGVATLVLPVDIAVPCGLIINELITNSLKHAFTSEDPARNAIQIEMERDASTVKIVVRDNGRGFADPGATTRASMGVTLIRDLCAQLRGSVAFENADGARCTIQFPVRAEGA